MKSEMVTNLKRQATQILAELKQTKEPVLITEQGKPSAYLVDIADFEALHKRLALLELIAKGEDAISNKQVSSHQQAKDKLSKWLS